MPQLPQVPIDNRVTVGPDAVSPLFVIRCAKPCGGARCNQMTDGQRRMPGTPDYAGGACWLGASFTRDGAEAYALRMGYQVQDEAP